MKTKKIILNIFFLTFAVSVMAVINVPFTGWDWLKENSTDIIIAHCTKEPPQYNTRFEYHSDIDISMVLKGTNNPYSSVLRSFYLPQKNRYYLIFSNYHDGSYQAIESYRVIDLGVGFSTNSIVGKPLDEQIQILFKLRIDVLNQEMKNDAAEKERLEEGLEK